MRSITELMDNAKYLYLKDVETVERPASWLPKGFDSKAIEEYEENE